jgi:FkbM family methyltransferase
MTNWERAPITFNRVDYPIKPKPPEESQPDAAPARITYEPLLIGALTLMKSKVILEYARRFNCRTLVETGTCTGEMIECIKDEFAEIHSIELKESWYRQAVARFSNKPYIHFYHGDSGQLLATVITRATSPAIYWLDAHFSGGHTARGSKDTPILDELASIFGAARLKDVILIDDSVAFGVDPAYPTIEKIKQLALAFNPKAVIETLPAGIIAITPKPPKGVLYAQSLSCQIVTLNHIYYGLFDGKTDGIFVDVGANDGYYCSNTWGLAMAGWRGLCFEPDPEPARKCKQFYSEFQKVTVVESAVGDRNGMATLYVDGNQTINRETVEKKPWGVGYGDLTKTVEVKVTTLNTALAKYKIPHSFDVLSIDVEGAELEVLAGIDFVVWKPKMVIIETGKAHPVESYRFHSKQIEAVMLAAGFKEIYFDAINSIYTREL